MFSPLLMRHETASSHFSPNNLAALPEKDGCKNRFYMHIRLAFFQKEEESFWHHLNGNPHFRQGIMAMLRLQPLLFKLKKWQLYTAILSSNYGKAQNRISYSLTFTSQSKEEMVLFSSYPVAVGGNLMNYSSPKRSLAGNTRMISACFSFTLLGRGNFTDKMENFVG
jgi:hypothetical protein